MSAPYIPLYIDDFDAATAHLSCEEEGAYMRLLKLSWRTPGCSLPNDDAWIARKIRMTPEQFEAVAKPVLREFFRLVRNRWVQGRLKKESDKLTARNRERSEAGKRGAAARALKNNDIEPSIANGLLKQPEPEPEPEPEPYISSSYSAGDWPERLREAQALAGDAVNMTVGAVHHFSDLKALCEPKTGEPCTWDDVRSAITVCAASARRRRKQITSWTWVREEALAIRDRRLAGLPPPAEIVPHPSSKTDNITEGFALARQKLAAMGVT